MNKTVTSTGKKLFAWTTQGHTPRQNQLITITKIHNDPKQQSDLKLFTTFKDSFWANVFQKVKPQRSFLSKWCKNGKDYLVSNLQSQKLLSKSCLPKPLICSMTTRFLSRNELSTVAYIMCCIRRFLRWFNIWYIICRLGVPRNKIIKFRRYLKKFTYPWFAYCIPTAILLVLGDMFAQYCDWASVPGTKCDRSFLTFLKNDWNRENALIYALKGFFLVGPILSKWSIFVCSKIRTRNNLIKIILKAILDVAILSPLVLALMAVIYDQKHSNIFKDDQEKTKKNIECKYYPAIEEIMYMNLITRPVVYLLLCHMLRCTIPFTLSRYIKLTYELWFAAYIASTFIKYRLRQKDFRCNSSTSVPEKTAKLCKLLNV